MRRLLGERRGRSEISSYNTDNTTICTSSIIYNATRHTTGSTCSWRSIPIQAPEYINYHKQDDHGDLKRATFGPDKTAFIYFTRTRTRTNDRSLTMKGRKIDDAHVKILGVILDQRLKSDVHASRVAKRGLRTVMALKRLRGIRPRQLYTSTVTSTIGHASMWAQTAPAKTQRMVEQIQKNAAVTITSGFRTIALPIAGAEVAIDTVHDRWSSQTAGFGLICIPCLRHIPFGK